MPPRTDAFKSRIVDLFFPRWCVSCGKEGQIICPVCLRSQARLIPPLCPGCGMPQASGILCPSCVSRQNALDGIRSPFQFTGAIREAIHKFKYQNIRAAAGQLGNMLAEYYLTSGLAADTVIPIPLHPKRLKERGYNQSALLAREFCRSTGLPLIEDCLTRIKNTPSQAKTSGVKERLKNLTGAYACSNSKIKGNMVLLIDDVSTSGATLEAAAATLKEAGAAEVWGLTLAREI